MKVRFEMRETIFYYGEFECTKDEYEEMQRKYHNHEDEELYDQFIGKEDGSETTLDICLVLKLKD